MDENGEILLLHASKNNACPLVLPRLDDFACFHSILVCSANSGLKNLLRYTTLQHVGLCKIRRGPPATSSSRSKRGSLHVVTTKSSNQGRTSGRALFLLACSSKISPFSSIYVIFLQGILKKEYAVY